MLASWLIIILVHELTILVPAHYICSKIIFFDGCYSVFTPTMLLVYVTCLYSMNSRTDGIWYGGTCKWSLVKWSPWIPWPRCFSPLKGFPLHYHITKQNVSLGNMACWKQRKTRLSRFVCHHHTNKRYLRLLTLRHQIILIECCRVNGALGQPRHSFTLSNHPLLY